MFTIRFESIAAAPSGLLVCGHPEDDSLDRMREHIRLAFAKSALKSSIEARYALSTAHITTFRFTSAALDFSPLLEQMDILSQVSFGEDTFDSVELVLNDWYQKASKSKILAKLPLQQR
ncbi:hypothetical protein [Agaribacter flavus]|uniref:Uncharacterized protein n=1 Tax=Agaribacter flavus TaxID=1902781 RepID=A0ABV7FSS1_9ALTE